MNPVCTHQLLNIAVLGKQGHRRNRPVSQHTFEVFRQGKAGVLDFGDCLLAAMLGLQDKLLHRCFHSAQHQHRPSQADHLQGTHSLVELLTGNAQLAGINGGQIRATRRLSIPGKAFECFCRAVQRFAKLVEDPGQRAQVVHGEIGLGCC